LGNLGSPLTGNFKRSLEDYGKVTSLFAGALLGDSFLGIRKGMGTIGSGDEASLSIGTLLGNMEGALLPETLK
jgi:hypothetical protein